MIGNEPHFLLIAIPTGVALAALSIIGWLAKNRWARRNGNGRRRR